MSSLPDASGSFLDAQEVAEDGAVMTRNGEEGPDGRQQGDAVTVDIDELEKGCEDDAGDTEGDESPIHDDESLRIRYWVS